MQVLHFAINSDLNVLIQKFTDYLVDAGHFVYICPIDEQHALAWRSRYKHNLRILKKEDLNARNIDYLIDFDDELIGTDVPKLNINVKASKQYFHIISFLENSNGKALLNKNTLELENLSHSSTVNIEYFLNEITETFIDSVIVLLRSYETLRFDSQISHNCGVIYLLSTLQLLKDLHMRYDEMTKREDVFILQNVAKSHETKIEINLSKEFNVNDLEIFTLTLLALFNSRQNGVYGYNLLCENNEITKFIDIQISDSYTQLLGECNASWFKIFNNPFFFGGIIHSTNPGILVSYDCQVSISSESCLFYIHYQKANNKLILSYNNNLYFFKTFEPYFVDFVNRFQDFKNGEILLKDLLGLPKEYVRKCLIEWNDTKREFPRNKMIHQLFEEQVEKTPNQVAVIFEGEQLTYSELNTKANQLAHYLCQQGIKPEMLIAIICERSLEMIIGILGILKAGGAYVPIDPSYPQERIQFMLEDANVSLTVTHRKVFEKLPMTESKVVIMDDHQAILEGCSKENLSHPFQPYHLAYVIYTSGSTGKPKGVMIEHKNLVHSTIARSFYYDEKPLSFLLLSSIAFDSSVAGIFWTLTQGGTLIIPRGSKVDPSDVHNLILKHQIAYFLCVPSLYAALLDGLASKDNHLKGVIIAGEACSSHLVEKHQLDLPKASLFNEYGPTEATVWASVSTLYDRVAQRIDRVTIGRPIANTQMYLLDGRQEPVPIGVPGELYIGGEGLARGYLNRTELTDEMFVANPFETQEEKSQMRKARLYKTGDLCRFHENGDIEYIGRIDNQVKIRGYRIELGEIEAALLRHPEVKETVTIIREDFPGKKLIVAYVVLRGKNTQLTSHLQALLPDYMVPSTFVEVESIPRTPHGKLDRKNLPVPHHQEDKTTYFGPRTEMEKALCEIWQDILKVEKVGIRDDFFKLGGDSISGVRLINRLKQKIGVKIQIKEIFKFRTIEHFCHQVLPNS